MSKKMKNPFKKEPEPAPEPPLTPAPRAYDDSKRFHAFRVRLDHGYMTLRPEIVLVPLASFGSLSEAHDYVVQKNEPLTVMETVARYKSVVTLDGGKNE